MKKNLYQIMFYDGIKFPIPMTKLLSSFPKLFRDDVRGIDELKILRTCNSLNSISGMDEKFYVVNEKGIPE